MVQALPEVINGVDFSGAALAGRNIWIARCIPGKGDALRLEALENLGRIAGAEQREPALRHLEELILQSRRAVWGMDFPFSLPMELFSESHEWKDQLRWVQGMSDAREMGLWCVRRSTELTGKMHIRRLTDTASKTPFDCYHYRIVHQTFHGMRLLSRLVDDPGTAVLPFMRDPKDAKRLLLEACPSSTIKRLCLPHQRYKYTGTGPMPRAVLAVRKVLYAGLGGVVSIPASLQRLISRNPGGDALDAVVAAVGAWQGLRRFLNETPPPRAMREGWVFH